MAQMEIIKQTWNQKYERYISHTTHKETLKFKEAVEVLKILKKHQDKSNRFKITEIVFFANYYMGTLRILTNRDVIYIFKFTDKQRMKIKDLLIDLNNGKEVENRYV